MSVSATIASASAREWPGVGVKDVGRPRGETGGHRLGKSGWSRSRVSGMASLAARNPKWLAMFFLSRIELVRSIQRIVAKRPDLAHLEDHGTVIEP